MTNSNRLTYKKEYSVEELQIGFDYFITCMTDYSICDEDRILIMSDESESLNYYVLHYLCKVPIAGRGRIFIFAPLDTENYIRENATSYCLFIPCERDMIGILCRLYTICLYKGSVMVSSLTMASDVDMGKIIDDSELEIRDIAALSVLRLRRTPPEVEIKKYDLEDKTQYFHYAKKNDDYFYQTAIYGRKEEYYDICASMISGNDHIKKDDKLVMFGVMKTSLEIKKRLYEYNFVAFIDNDIKKQGTMVEGLPVIAPEKIKDEYGDDIKIIVSSKYSREMCSQLEKIGYRVNENIFLAYVKSCVKYKNAISSTPEEIFSAGEKVFIDLRNKFPNELIMSLPYSGTGDAYLAGMYMEEMVKEHNIDKFVITVTSNSCKKVLKLFGLDSYILNMDNSRKLLNYARIVGFKNANYIVLNDCIDHEDVLQVRGCRDIDLHTMFQRFVFRTSKKITVPKISNNNSDEIFVKYGLRKGRTVLLSPYATSVASITDNTWYRIVKCLKNKGFDVCTNIGSDKEEAIPGTVGVFLPYDIVIDFVNKAGFFIGLRSGLCDIVSTSSAWKFIFYPTWKREVGDIGNHPYRYYSLRRMEFSKKNLIELQFDEGNDAFISNAIDRRLDEILSERKHNDIGIVICNYNGGNDTVNCVNHILQSDCDNYDVIVVDNASEDDSIKLLEENFGNKITIIRNTENLGGAGGFNTGFNYALDKGYEFIMAVDHDAFLAPYSINLMYEYLLAHMDVGMVSAKIMVNGRDDLVLDFEREIDFRNYNIYSMWLNTPEYPESRNAVESDFCPTTAAMITRNALLASGGMNPKCFIYFDDVEMGYLIRRSGLRCVSLGQARAWHKSGMGRSSAKNTFARYYFNRNRYRFFARYIPKWDIERFAEHVLNECFSFMYGARRDGSTDVYEVNKYILEDFIEDRRGKALRGRIVETTNCKDSQLMNVIKEKKKIQITVDAGLDIWRGEHLQEHLEQLVPGLDYSINMKMDSTNVVMQKNTNDVEYQDIVIVDHAKNANPIQENVIYVDLYNNIIFNKDDYDYYQNYDREYSLFKNKYWNRTIEAINNIRSKED
ncbi:glycosyltransferase family 2 protein [Butyrivibrio sp. LC3010]|uniref:glycosyltransferase family 2 protein n=1 Tax=Butyrivibrio sp. LC3010 TaxID=1280680 RepID=UPI000422ED13|nr:glycosyltransferase family 2 protein [Butyrivibrio sp. LC3010]